MADTYCGFTRNGIPDTCKKGNPFSMMAGFYAVTHGTSFTIAEAEDLTNYTSKVIEKTLLPVHGVFSIDDTSTEKSVMTSAMGRKKKNNDGFRGYKIGIDLTHDGRKAIKGWEDSDMDIIPYDHNGVIKFTCPDGTNLKGFAIDYFDVEKSPVVTDSNAELTYIEIQEFDPDEWDENGYWMQPKKNTAIADRWSPTDVKTISLITITATATSSNACTLTISLPTSEMKDGAIVSRAITGAVAANIKLYDDSGDEVTTHTLTAISPTSNGQYTLANTTLTADYTLYFLAQSSDEKLFESSTVTLT